MTSGRHHQFNGLALVVFRERPTLTHFHSTPPGSRSLLQVSIHWEEVHSIGKTLCVASQEGNVTSVPKFPKLLGALHEERFIYSLVQASTTFQVTSAPVM